MHLYQYIFCLGGLAFVVLAASYVVRHARLQAQMKRLENWDENKLSRPK